jgi:hypothetical protein
MPLFIKGYIKNYIKNLFLLHYPKCCIDVNDNDNNDLNEYGNLLKSFSLLSNNRAQQIDYAKKIFNILNIFYDENEIIKYVDTYNNIKRERDELIINNHLICCGSNLDQISQLSDDNNKMWGSKSQYLYGYICHDIFKTHEINLPIFMCSALNPTGGICGPGNMVLYNGDIKDPIMVHSCIHDASGYCYNYHRLGLGYNYLNTFFALPTKSPLSCQIMGIYMCRKIKNKINKK